MKYWKCGKKNMIDLGDGRNLYCGACETHIAT
jgi:hypothetical protein